MKKQQKENEELIKRTPVEATPFTVITTLEQGSFISLGKYRVSEVMETENECIKTIHEKPWNLMMAVMKVIADDAVTEQNDKDELKYIQFLNKQKEQNNGNN